MAVQYACTPALRDAAQAMQGNASLMAGLGDAAKEALRQAAESSALSPAKLLQISAALRASDGPHIHALLQGSKPSLPQAWYPPKPAEKTPEQKAALEALKLKTAERQYQSMIAGVTRAEREAKEFAGTGGLKEVNAQIGMGVNVIVAMVTAFVVGYNVAGYNDFNQTGKLVAGLVCLIGMLFVEVVLMMIYVYQHEREQMPHEKAEARRVESIMIEQNSIKQLEREAQRSAVVGAAAKTTAALTKVGGKAAKSRGTTKKSKKVD